MIVCLQRFHGGNQSLGFCPTGGAGSAKMKCRGDTAACLFVEVPYACRREHKRDRTSGFLDSGILADSWPAAGLCDDSLVGGFGR
ncbi:hypothetical protein SBV1_10016 [Verrucomicrobia bacterium]|nr:hypothetical protein SBV1_10016 [Verrucomicrobiota bacterium]